jgi:Fe-Mn family superoxide dismutase
VAYALQRGLIAGQTRQLIPLSSAAGFSMTEPIVTYPFQLPKLPYAYSALEPHFYEATMRLHHDAHHQAYVDKLNAALKDYPQLHQMTAEDLLRSLPEIPEAIRTAVRNNAGGHVNHEFFWNVIGPPSKAVPQGRLLDALNTSFGSVEDFKKKFSEKAGAQFASGWTCLVADVRHNVLEIVELPNHTVVSNGPTGLLICDVWEHAYYLKYQNRRPEFIKAFWNVVAWDKVEKRLEDAGADHAMAA